MERTFMLTGIVLNTMPVGEYDKRIMLLTRERGRIAAFARGARRPRSSLQAATERFCFGRYEAYEGRSSYTVVRAEIDNPFRELAQDLDRTFYGCYFLEVAERFTQENLDCTPQLKLLYQTLRALSVKSLDHRLVRLIYELKTLYFCGVGPNVFACVRCGSREGLRFFDLQGRGVLCSACAGQGAGTGGRELTGRMPAGGTAAGPDRETAGPAGSVSPHFKENKAAGLNAAGDIQADPAGSVSLPARENKADGLNAAGDIQAGPAGSVLPRVPGGLYPLDAAAVYALQYIASSPVEKLYTFTVTEPVLLQLGRVAGRYMKLYTDREFKTLAFLPEE